MGPVTPSRPPRPRRVPTAIAIGVGAALAVAAAESLLIVHGTWLTADFGMTVSQVGASTMFIVAAELLGEGVVIALADRVGLERTLFRALLASAVVYGGLGLVGNDIGLALAATGVLFVTFEVTVVVLIALATVTTDDRAGLLGTLMAAVACGNAAGAIAGPLLFARGGIALSGGVSAAAAAAAVVVLRRAGVVPSRAVRQPPTVQLQGSRNAAATTCSMAAASSSLRSSTDGLRGTDRRLITATVEKRERRWVGEADHPRRAGSR
jgi:hypothetical protein